MDRSGREKRRGWRTLLQESKGMLLILAAEFFGSGMDACARLLETRDGDGMAAMQVFLSPLLDLSALRITLLQYPPTPPTVRETWASQAVVI